MVDDPDTNRAAPRPSAARAGAGDQEQQRSFHCLITGHVQGVGFRKWARNTARSLGIGGWVRNRGDKVEMMFSATPGQLTEFKGRLDHGPPRARVENVEHREVRARHFKRFRILDTKGKPDETATAPARASKPSLAESFVFDPDFVTLCQSIVDSLPPHLRKPNRVAETPADWGFGQLVEAAQSQGMVLTRLPGGPPRRYMFEGRGHRFGMISTRLADIPHLNTTIANDKSLTMTVLSGAGLPVPHSRVAETLNEAIRIFADHGGPLVFKPSHGSNSDGVTTNVRDKTQLAAAFTLASETSPDGRVIVEEYVSGVDLRVLMAGDKFVVAYLRLPANVVGDGSRTVADLIDAKNADRSTLPGIGPSNPVPRDKLADAMLEEQGLTYDDVPDAGKFVLLGLRPNTSDGADQVPVCNLLHPDIHTACIGAARALGANGFWGFDVLTEDFTKSLQHARTVFCEANNRPYGGIFRHTTHGPYTNFFDDALEMVAPQKPVGSEKPSEWWLELPRHPEGAAQAVATEPDVAEQAGRVANVTLGKLSRKDAVRQYHIRVKQPEYAGRLRLVDSLRPPADIQASDIARPPEINHVPLELDPDLTSAIAHAMGDGAARWRPDLVKRDKSERVEFWDTGLSSSFATYLFRHLNILTLRNTLSSAGVAMTPLEPIGGPDDIANLASRDIKAGCLWLNDRWNKKGQIAISSDSDFAAMASDIPKRVFPAYLEQWSSDARLEVVVAKNEVIAVGIRDTDGFSTVGAVPPRVTEIVATIAWAVPGLFRARLLFRQPQQAPDVWMLHHITADIAHMDFAAPESGPPIDIPVAIAAHLQKAARRIVLTEDPK